MKRAVTFVLALVCVLSLVGCGGKTDNLQTAFPEYYGLDPFKGLEVYVWETEDGDYYCGVLAGTNRNKTYEEISNLTKNGATIEEMKNILASYDIDKESIAIIPVAITSSDFVIIDSDFTQISEMFWGT